MLGVFVMIGSSLLSGLVWNLGHGLLPAALITSLALAAASVLVATIREPRRAHSHA